MGIVPRDPDRPSSPPDNILGRNGEETAKRQRAQTALEIPIPRQESTKRIPTIFNPKYEVHPDSRFSKIVEIIRTTGEPCQFGIQSRISTNSPGGDSNSRKLSYVIRFQSTAYEADLSLAKRGQSSWLTASGTKARKDHSV